MNAQTVKVDTLEAATSFIEAEICTSCIICGNSVPVYNCSPIVFRVCDECKDTIAELKKMLGDQVENGNCIRSDE